MKGVHFLDTSILLEIFEVPKLYSKEKSPLLKKEFEKIFEDSNQEIYIPISVIIETGNHINGISNNRLKMECLDKFIEILNMIINEDIPFKNPEYSYDQERFKNIINKIKVYGQSNIGIGDLFIIEEYKKFIEKCKEINQQNTRVRIWSTDSDLDGYEEIFQ